MQQYLLVSVGVKSQLPIEIDGIALSCVRRLCDTHVAAPLPAEPVPVVPAHVLRIRVDANDPAQFLSIDDFLPNVSRLPAGQRGISFKGYGLTGRWLRLTATCLPVR